MAKKSNRFLNTFGSKPEKEIFHLLEDIFPAAKIYSQYPYALFSSTTNNSLVADIFIFTFEIVVEYDGEFHYKPVVFDKDEEAAQKNFEEGKQRDSIKDKLCKESGIRMLRISCYDWQELETTSDKISYLKERIIG